MRGGYTDSSYWNPPKKTCGSYTQKAEARFFCNGFKDGAGPRKVGNTVSDWRNTVTVTIPGCNATISSGILKGVSEERDGEPWFWKIDPITYPDNELVGFGYRGFRSSWRCCGNDDDFFNASTIVNTSRSP